MEKAELIERLKGRLGRTARGGNQVDAGPSDLITDHAGLKSGRLVTDQAGSGQEDLSTAQAIGPSGSLSTAQATRPSGRLVTDQAGLEPERLVTDQAPVSGKLDDAAMTLPIIPSRPFDHPAAWTVADIGCKDAFAFDLTDRRSGIGGVLSAT